MDILTRPGAERTTEFVSVQQAADFLNLTERSIRRYIADGTLPAYRIGTKQIRLRAADVMALLVPIATASAS